MYIVILIVLFLLFVLYKTNQGNVKSNTKKYKINLLLAFIFPALTLPNLFMIDPINQKIKYILIGLIIIVSILNLITGISQFKEVHQTKK
ncbi:hypothetical protein [Virgibacillus sp. SK37]|uniref:hypothetical protein n=1 Tax=Virgibacillus sp. SK37 TaxID=403957 RepID=UPI0004D10BFA|nr:hypothetical protein [Virgibacillus sp. SK37]AIF45747.1 hypothetical protein X953_19925 [Virgibacillus sp. SK37]